jgi:hypothetical protein
MSKLRDAARGQPCQVRLPGICNFNPETTVLAHYRLAGTCGTGIKPPDLLGAWCCSSCHDVVDGRNGKANDITASLFNRLNFAEGCLRTINELIRQGKLK